MEPRWHVTYTSGSWIVLAGPASVVALDSRASSQATLASELWALVNLEARMAELVSRLVLVDVTRLPGLAVLYFERDGDRDVVRALLRGDVRVLAESGQTVAHGADVLTWQEVRLADLARIEVDLGGTAPDETLPLMRGAVRAGRLQLTLAGADADDTPGRDVAPVTSLPPDAPEREPAPAPAPAPAPDQAASEEQSASSDDADDADTEDTEKIEVSEDSEAEDNADTLADYVVVPSRADIEAMENADTQSFFMPPLAVARLRAPDGSTVDLDRPVLIGRAPSDSGFENSHPHLLTVPSPSQDISRTHLLVAPEGESIVVTDLHSTNGTTVIRPGPGVERMALPSGQSVTVAVGSVLELGDEVAILIDTASAG